MHGPLARLTALALALVTMAYGVAAQQAATHPAPPAPVPALFESLANGVALDPRTGLSWTQADNGADIAWAAAGRHCQAKGDGWRLPSADELQAGFGLAQSASCKKAACNTSSGLKVSGFYFWSSERDAAGSTAWAVNLSGDLRLPYPLASRRGLRVLCVRQGGPVA
jgi:hypothetical protein